MPKIHPTTDFLTLFYLMLPEGTLRQCFDSMKINRKARREMEKCKAITKKLSFVIHSDDLRRLFADAAYERLKEEVPFTLEEATYDMIYDGITQENQLAYTTFFFRWCYEKDADGTNYDAKYFDQFIRSPKFRRILAKKDPNAPDPPAETNEETPPADEPNNNTAPPSADEPDNNTAPPSAAAEPTPPPDEDDRTPSALTDLSSPSDVSIDTDTAAFSLEEIPPSPSPSDLPKDTDPDIVEFLFPQEESADTDTAASSLEEIPPSPSPSDLPKDTDPDIVETLFPQEESASPSQPTTKEVTRMKWIGRIEKRSTFYNFFPQHILGDNTIDTPHFFNVIRQQYPSLGGINLSYDTTGESKRFLDGLTVDVDGCIYPRNAYIVEFDDAELEPNAFLDGTINSYYEKKLDLQGLVNRGIILRNRIQPAVSQGIYKLVTSENMSLTPQGLISGNIYLNASSSIVEGESVVLHHNGTYYGPLTAHVRNGRACINIESDTQNYLVPYFPNQRVTTFELQKYDQSNHQFFESRFIYVTIQPSLMDMITDEILLSKIAEEVSLDLAHQNPEEFSHRCSTSPFLSKLPQNIIQQRLERIDTVIKNLGNYEKQQGKLFDALLDLYRNEPSEAFNSAVRKSEVYKEQQEKTTQESRRADAAEEKSREFQEELNLLNQQINQNEGRAADTTDTASDTITSEQAAQYESTIADLQQQLSQYQQITDLEEKKEKLDREVDTYMDLLHRYRGKVNSIRNEVGEAIRQGADEASIAFDPFIASRMMKAAAEWDADEEKNQYSDKDAKLSGITPSSLRGQDLIDYLVDYVQARRNYTRNEIINIYISLAQSFLTIFSGEPGIGKTSMGNIIADTLGLMQYGEDINRFVEVTVERGWSSKRDFIGYYNPLTRRYDKNNSKVYQALQQLDHEKESSSYPFVILLDEANLSPIEYYWADFMGLTDRLTDPTSNHTAFLNIGTDQDLYIPKTLRFIATINTDQTTEKLSPRLIDRASIIKLPNVAPKTVSPTASQPKELITWQNFYETFSSRSEINPRIQPVFEKIGKLFNNYGMNVSPRIQLGVERYIQAAQSIMEDEKGATAHVRALDFAIVQKLLPKINGHYSIYERFFEELKQHCKDEGLEMTETAINKIIEAQGNNMGYCQYLI